MKYGDCGKDLLSIHRQFIRQGNLPMSWGHLPFESREDIEVVKASGK